MPLRGFRRGEAIEGHGPIITDLLTQHLVPPLPHGGICGYTAYIDRRSSPPPPPVFIYKRRLAKPSLPSRRQPRAAESKKRGRGLEIVGRAAPGLDRGRKKANSGRPRNICIIASCPSCTEAVRPGATSPSETTKRGRG